MSDEIENHFTVFIRLPFNRGDFVDPPPVAWSAAKERELWELISRQSKGNETDWKLLADRFQVTQPFLLQQAAWLYERQLSQVRAQMRRMGGRQSSTASPAPPSTVTSVLSTQTARRGGSLSSRTPSRLSIHGPNQTPAATSESNTPVTPARSRASLPFRSSNTAVNPPARTGSASKPLSRKSSKDNEPLNKGHSRRGSAQITRSPAQMEAQGLTSSEEDVAASRMSYRRPNPASLQRRTPSLRKSQHVRKPSISHVDEETEEEDAPAFLPFAETERRAEGVPAAHDPSATLRGGLQQSAHAQAQAQAQAARPLPRRSPTSERVVRTADRPVLQHHPVANLTSSASSMSSSSATAPLSSQTRPLPGAHVRRTARHHHHHDQQPSTNLPTPLSPTQQAALAAAAGLSPRRRPHNNSGAESSPSMGSSFSDLDDASVTQSALEEALMSGMGSVATTQGGLGSRVGGISGLGQALRSRYFDARSPSSGSPAQKEGDR